MSKKQFSFIFLAIFFIFLCWNFKAKAQQTCDCKKEFEWLKTTFEQNDAGFKYIIDKKGKEMYEQHNANFFKKLQNLPSDLQSCANVLLEWLYFFRTGHISFGINPNVAQNNQKTNEKLNFDTWEKIKFTQKEFETHIKTLKKATFEGVWQLNAYQLGIKKVGEEYLGFIIKSGNPNWTPEQVKFRFSFLDNQAKGFFYMGDHSPIAIKKVKLVGNNYLKLGDFILKRLNSSFSDKEKLKMDMELVTSDIPVMKILSENTLVLRVPSFNENNRKAIDSLLSVYHSQITSKKNLIIDIRNNGGGSDLSFEKIIPYLYTNPIRTINVEMLSTPLNNSRYDKMIANNVYTDAEKKSFKKRKKILDENLGKFVSFSDDKVSILTEKKILPFPQNVAILINEGNGSTSEQFLLACKQSKKVKLFGKTTAGVLDISNMHFVPSESNLFELGYCLSKSFRIPAMAIDDKGIMPDYYIDDSIQDYEWLEHTENILNEK